MKNNLLEYKGYRAKIEYDAEENIFVGDVIGISDMLSFSSENTGDLVQKFHDCVENYLDMCAEVGKTPEREFTGSFCVRVEPEEQRIATICAAASDISFNQYVGKALKEYNKKNRKIFAI